MFQSPRSLGHSTQGKGYKILNSLTKEIFLDWDVVFHKHIFPFQHGHKGIISNLFSYEELPNVLYHHTTPDPSNQESDSTTLPSHRESTIKPQQSSSPTQIHTTPPSTQNSNVQPSGIVENATNDPPAKSPRPIRNKK